MVRVSGPVVTPVLIEMGRLQMATPYVNTFRGRGSYRDVVFHVVVEASPSPAEDLARWAVDAFQRALGRQGRMTLTSTLSNAIQECHAELLRRNQRRPEEERTALGLTCVALRGEDAYVAQAGPGVGYVRDTRGVRQALPALEKPGDGGPAQPGALGLGPEKVPISFYHQPLRADGALLVAYDALRQFANLDGIELLLDAPPRDTAGRLYQLSRDQAVFVALLFTPAGKG